MPLFEYACSACGHRFEHLTRGNAPPTCPACASADLEKQLSAFAVGANGSSSSPEAGSGAPCGMCGDPRGPGGCSLN